MAKVLFAAGAFTVAAFIVALVVTYVVAGPGAAEWLGEHMVVVNAISFAVGVPVMFRWLR